MALDNTTENYKNQLQSLVDALDRSAIVSIADKEGKIIKVNEEFCRISQYTEKELLGNDHRIINSGHHSKEFWQKMWKDITQGKTWRAEVKNKAKDGSFYWVDTVINPMFDENKKITSYLSIRSLITDKKNAEIEIQSQKNDLEANERKLKQNLEELSTTQEKLQKQKKQIEKEAIYRKAILENAPIMIISTDLEGTITSFNSRAEKLLGYESEEVVDKLSPSIFHDIDEIKNYAKELSKEFGEKIPASFEVFTVKAKKNIFTKKEWTYISKESKRFPVELNISAIKNEETGEIIGYLGMAQDITERKEAKKELQKLSIVARETSNAIVITDAEGYTTWVNEGFTKITGYTLPEIVGKKTGKLLQGKETNPEHVLAIRKGLKSKKAFTQEILNYDKNGRKFWIEISITPTFDKRTGEVTQFIGIQVDITKRIQNEEDLKLLSVVASKTSNAVVITDANGYIIWVNEGFVKITGYHLKEVIDKKPGAFLQGKDTKPRHILAIREGLKSKKSFTQEILNYTKYGKPYWLELSITPIFDEKTGELTQFIGIENDITVRKEAEKLILEKNKALQTSEEELRQNIEELQTIKEELQRQNIKVEKALKELKSAQSQLIQSEKMATLGQLVANIAHEINTPLGAIGSSSVAIEEMLGHTLYKLPQFLSSLSQDELQLFNETVEFASKIHPSLSSREQRVIKYKFIEFLESYENIEYKNRCADFIVDSGLYEDEEIVKKVLKNKNSYYLFEAIYQVSSIIRSNQTIQMGTERTAKIILALKTFARQDQTGVKEDTDINKSIENTLILYRNQIKQGIDVYKELDAIPPIMGFPDELIQVWTNLIHNAIQAMNNEGVLTVKSYEKNGNILVSVTDTGDGIPKNIQKRIFDPFFTTKKAGEGSGLGLDIVKKIVEKHDGSIYFESEEGKGTTFFVEIPIA